MITKDLDCQNCPDCGVEIGQPHEDGCDVARCLSTGQQRLMCPAPHSGFHDCGQEIWTGLWPGTAECRDLGWFCYWRDPAPGEQYGEFVRCSADHPDAIDDLNRLHRDAHWNPNTGRWEPGPCDHSYTDHVVVDEEGPDMLRVCGTCGNTLSETLLAALGYPLPSLGQDPS